jgi:uncharacterized membrane protein YdjX (TVP38/TMEM64 family)
MTTSDNNVCKDFPDEEYAGVKRYGAVDATEVMMMMEDVELAGEPGDSNNEASPSTTNGTREEAAAEVAEGPSAATEDDDNATTKPKSCCSPTKLMIGLVLLALVTFVIIDSSTTGYVRSAVSNFLEWIETHAVAGIFLFIMVYFIATVFFIPGSLLTLGAGFVFASAFGLGPGVALGTLVVFTGAASGALAAFLLGRYLLRDAVGRLSTKYAVFQALDQALIGNGLKIFILLRLSPIVPFAALNYVAGVTAVSLRDYAIALFAILPGTLLYVFLGASTGSLADNANGSSGQSPTLTIVVIVVGVVLGVAAVYLTTRYARQELNRILAERNQEAQVQESEAAKEADEERPNNASPTSAVMAMAGNDETTR